jgi:hypothetical protein
VQSPERMAAGAHAGTNDNASENRRIISAALGVPTAEGMVTRLTSGCFKET